MLQNICTRILSSVLCAIVKGRRWPPCLPTGAGRLNRTHVGSGISIRQLLKSTRQLYLQPSSCQAPKQGTEQGMHRTTWSHREPRGHAPPTWGHGEPQGQVLHYLEAQGTPGPCTELPRDTENPGTMHHVTWGHGEPWGHHRVTWGHGEPRSSISSADSQCVGFLGQP